MKVIFLDVDGVLTHEDYISGVNFSIDNEKIKILSEIVKNTDAKIVLNSTYKKYAGTKGYNPYNVLEAMLKNENIDIYGATEDITPKFKKIKDPETGLQVIGDIDINTTRAKAVDMWIKDHEVDSFVIIDDILSYYDSFGLIDNLIITDKKEGLTIEDADKAIDILNNNKKIR